MKPPSSKYRVIQIGDTYIPQRRVWRWLIFPQWEVFRRGGSGAFGGTLIAFDKGKDPLAEARNFLAEQYVRDTTKPSIYKP